MKDHHDQVKFFVDLWRTDFGEGAAPIQFSDDLAYALFCAGVERMLDDAFARGRRYEQKRRKHRMAAKYQRLTGAKG
jgi:hypothetical protein